MVVVKGQQDLFEVVLAMSSTGRLSGASMRREHQGDQDPDNRDHDQEFDQRKSAGTALGDSPRWNLRSNDGNMLNPPKTHGEWKSETIYARSQGSEDGIPGFRPKMHRARWICSLGITEKNSARPQLNRTPSSSTLSDFLPDPAGSRVQSRSQSEVQVVSTKTFMAKKELVKPQWFVIDAEGQIVGHLATKIATILMGKHKPEFTRMW